MATFTLAGFNMSPSADAPGLGVTPAELSLVSSPVDGTFRFTYLTDEFEDHRIALTDHNLLIDGVHIHDRPAHATFELAQASWAFGETSRLLTLRYEDSHEEFLFSFGPADLPDLTTEAGMAELSYYFKETRLPTHDDVGAIHLAGVPGIEIEGTYAPQAALEMPLLSVLEAFDFVPGTPAPNPEDAPVEELVALAGEDAQDTTAQDAFELVSPDDLPTETPHTDYGDGL